MGLTLSLYVVYLHNAHGFSTGFATLLLAASALAGLVTSPVWGTMTDHFGPVKVLLLAGFTEAGALAYWAFIHSETSAVIGAVLIAIFGGAGWGPGGTLLVRLVAPEHRQRAYGFNFMLVNFGMGIGGLVSAAVVDLHHPLTFRYLYLGNVGVTLISGAFFATLWKFGHVQRPETTSSEKHSFMKNDGWSVVLRDRRLILFVTASLILMLGGYGALDAGLSLFVVNNLHMSVHVIGIFFFVNTTTIVLSQLLVLNVIEHKSRTRVLALVGLLWFVFWLVLSVAIAMPKIAAVVALASAMMVFALGETMMSPIGPAIVNEMAPEHLRGRYNAAQGLTWGISGTLAPAITALFFDNGWGNWWPLSVGIMSLAGGALMLNLRRHLSAGEDGRG
jgi:MFS family permease